jgi:hypothetical protein
MSTSEISDKNVVMASFDDVPEKVRKAFEECKKAREEKEMQELLTCYAKDHRGSITQIKELVLPPIDYTKRYTQQRYHIHLPLLPPKMSPLYFLSMLNLLET